jgi:hypothetical protein
MAHSSITMTYDVYGHLFHDPAKDVDLMDEMERGVDGGVNRRSTFKEQGSKPSFNPMVFVKRCAQLR